MTALRKLEDRVDEIHDMFRPTLATLDLATADDIAISTAIYNLTGELRKTIVAAKENVKKEQERGKASA